MTLNANWSYPTAIRFGAGRISEIADACFVAGIKKPLLVTDRGLAGMEITQKTLNLLDDAGLGRAIFADVDPNPNEKMLQQVLPLIKLAIMMALLPLVVDLVWILEKLLLF